MGIILALLARQIGPPKSEKTTKLIALLAYPATAFHLWAVLFVSQENEWMFERGGFLLIAVMSALIIYGLTVSAQWSLYIALWNQHHSDIWDA